MLQHDTDAHPLWAELGIVQTTLGHFRLAQKAYERALALDPNNPWYAHNLGHLFDVALGDAKRSLPFLTAAHESLPHVLKVTLSLAHALTRVGNVVEAQRILSESTRWDANNIDNANHTEERDRMLHALRQGPEKEGPITQEPTSSVVQALSHLPLTSHERKQIHARFMRLKRTFPTEHANVLGAAIAYVFVQARGLPLSASEVAAPFGAKLRAMCSLSKRVEKSG